MRTTDEHRFTQIVEIPVVRRQSFTRLLCHAGRLPSVLIDRLWKDADGLIASGTSLKAGNRTTVVRIDADGAAWVLKRYNLRGPAHTLVHSVMRSRARKNWFYGRHLCSAGITTPQPTAFLEHRLGPLRTRSYLLTPFISGTPLCDLFRQPQPPTIDFSSLYREFASLWKQLGELRLTHGDTKSSNYLLTDAGRIWLIDLDGMQTHRFRAGFRRARLRDWKRFMKNWQTLPLIAAGFRDAAELHSVVDERNRPIRRTRAA